jgi:hypothetical protein
MSFELLDLKDPFIQHYIQILKKIKKKIKYLK